MAPGPEAAASLVVIDPNGRRTRLPLVPPFRMGRAPDNHLVLRDSRVSRNHAQIVFREGSFILEDLGSRHGVWAVSYTHLRAHETGRNLVCRLLLEKKKT